MKRKEKNDHPINTSRFGKLLQRAFLSGIIKECVIRFGTEKVEIEATDMSDTLSLHCSEEIGIPIEKEVGIGDLSVFSKLFSNDDRQSSLIFGKDFLKVVLRGHGSVKIAITEPDLIPTAVVDAVSDEREYTVHTLSIKPQKYSVALCREGANDFKYYSSLLKNKEVVVQVKNGKVSITSGSNETHRFSVPIGKVSDCGDMSIEVNCEYFSNIIDVLDWEDVEDTPKILFTCGQHPIIICQGTENVWGLTPSDRRDGKS